MCVGCNQPYRELITCHYITDNFLPHGPTFIDSYYAVIIQNGDNKTLLNKYSSSILAVDKVHWSSCGGELNLYKSSAPQSHSYLQRPSRLRGINRTC